MENARKESTMNRARCAGEKHIRQNWSRQWKIVQVERRRARTTSMSIWVLCAICLLHCRRRNKMNSLFHQQRYVCAREPHSPKTHLIITQKTKSNTHTQTSDTRSILRCMGDGQRTSMGRRMRDEEEMEEIEISQTEMNRKTKMSTASHRMESEECFVRFFCLWVIGNGHWSSLIHVGVCESVYVYCMV